jgi:hypothetical protein
MKHANTAIEELRLAVHSLQSQLAALSARTVSLESVPASSGKKKKKEKKSKHKHKHLQPDGALASLKQTISLMSPDEIAAVIVKFHKNPKHMADKLERQRKP